MEERRKLNAASPILSNFPRVQTSEEHNMYAEKLATLASRKKIPMGLQTRDSICFHVKHTSPTTPYLRNSGKRYHEYASKGCVNPTNVTKLTYVIHVSREVEARLVTNNILAQNRLRSSGTCKIK